MLKHFAASLACCVVASAASVFFVFLLSVVAPSSSFVVPPPAVLGGLPPLLLLIFSVTGCVPHIPTEVVREGAGFLRSGNCGVALLAEAAACLAWVFLVRAVFGFDAAAAHFRIPATEDSLQVFLSEALFSSVSAVVCTALSVAASPPASSAAPPKAKKLVIIVGSLFTSPLSLASFHSFCMSNPMPALAVGVAFGVKGWPTRVLAPLFAASLIASFLAIRNDPATPPLSVAIGLGIRKIKVFLLGITHLLLSKDKKWNKSKVTDPDKIKDRVRSHVKIMFVRHGESEWNMVFNKGFGPSFPLRLVRAILLEIKLLVSPDSIFIDSPLSQEGVEQAEGLSRFLESYKPTNAATDEAVALLRGESGRSILVVSNLRRAVSTLVIALWHRIRPKTERVIVHSCLQEISRNIDTLALAPSDSPPYMPVLNRLYGAEYDPAAVFDLSLNGGNKKLSGNGLARMMQFAAWASQQTPGTTIIVGGHSLWFRHFFQTFLPPTFNHQCKTKKIVNCGVVLFSFEKALFEGKTVYRIDPDSLNVVYGGFTAR